METVQFDVFQTISAFVLYKREIKAILRPFGHVESKDI